LFNSKDFDKWSGDYDKSISPSSNEFPFIGYYDVLAYVQHQVKPALHQKIIDVGIGTALLSHEISKTGCEIYGVDFSKNMITKAREKIPSAHLCVVDIAKDHFGEFNNLKFDRIISSYFFHHLDRNQQITFLKRSIRENLNPFGKIIIADVGLETRSSYDKAHRDFAQLWDDDEFYLCGDEIINSLNAESIHAKYTQVSSCAGVLIYPG